MDYMQRIIEDFGDKDIFPAWGILSRRMNPHEGTLEHPSSMTEVQISDHIPRRFNIDEILKLLPAKQKEIARRLNISKLPSDRPSGMLGQTALFEILRNKGFDFKSYMDAHPFSFL